MTVPEEVAGGGVPGRPAPSALSGRALGLVFTGGVLGTAARAWLVEAWPAWGRLGLVNLLGAFALGLLLARLGRVRSATGPDAHQELQWLTATGFLGAFTTYGALAAQLALPLMMTFTDPPHGAQYAALWALVSLVTTPLQVALGVLVAWLGWRIGSRAGRAER